MSKNGINKERAAILFAENEMLPEGEIPRSLHQIAESVDVSVRTISRWKLDTEFQAMIEDAKGKIVADALRLPSAQKHQRIRTLHTLTQKLLHAIELRSQTYTQMADTPEAAARSLFGSETPPWAATGLFIAKQKISASGKVVTDWEPDVATMREIRANYEHIARETGQWVEQSQLQMDGGMRIEIVGIADEDMP